jgi:hypothetical protein
MAMLLATLGSVSAAHAGYWTVQISLNGSASFTGGGAGTTLGFLTDNIPGSAPVSTQYNMTPNPSLSMLGGTYNQTLGTGPAVALDSSVQTLSGLVNGTVVGVPDTGLTYPEVYVTATWVSIPFDSDGDGIIDDPDNPPVSVSLARSVYTQVAWGAVSCICYGGDAHFKLDNYNASGALTGEIIESHSVAPPGPAPLRGSLVDQHTDSDSIAPISYSSGVATWHFPIIDMTHWLNCNAGGQGQNGGISQVKLSLSVN